MWVIQMFEQRMNGKVLEHKHDDYDYWHSVDRIHKEDSAECIDISSTSIEIKEKLRSQIKNIYLYMLDKQIKSITLDNDNLIFESNNGDTWTLMSDELAYIVGCNK